MLARVLTDARRGSRSRNRRPRHWTQHTTRTAPCRLQSGLCTAPSTRSLREQRASAPQNSNLIYQSRGMYINLTCVKGTRARCASQNRLVSVQRFDAVRVVLEPRLAGERARKPHVRCVANALVVGSPSCALDEKLGIVSAFHLADGVARLEPVRARGWASQAISQRHPVWAGGRCIPGNRLAGGRVCLCTYSCSADCRPRLTYPGRGLSQTS